ncbi:UBX domain-containing protein 10 [Pempheris klunzingeri]|uniref:UBX domain-containing protein 10 n=1 Tax=Pempheris klunzingeri TaxID=3127111 RepID=UPI00397F99E6
MHLTRPKSSKGRSRPAVNTSPRTGDPDSTQGPPTSPHSPVYGRDIRSQSQPMVWQAGQLSRDEVLQMLQRPPAAPPQSLNKYKVLPSIGGRRSEGGARRGLDDVMCELSLCDDAQRHRHGGSDPPTGQAVIQSNAHLRVRPKPPDPGPMATTGSLLLAIRAPCGSRFEQHFEPTDTLLAVRASAELRFGATYGDAAIETMDVPRRTLADMEMTLAQCGILNRSVLCISQKDPELT